MSNLKVILTMILVMWTTGLFAAELDLAVSTSTMMGNSYYQWLGMALVLIILLQSFVYLARGLRRFVQQENINVVTLKLWESRVTQAESRLKQQESLQDTWSGTRKFEIIRKQKECNSITSFYLEAHDKKPIPDFKPGQYLTFRLNIPNQAKPIVRCYSLSDCMREGVYRISIKYAPPSAPELLPGISSSFFHDHLDEHDILDVQAPSGGFFLDPLLETPIVLIAGGIGLTPILSMLNAVVDAGINREIWFFYGLRNTDDYMGRQHLETIAKNNDNIHLYVCFSEPEESEVLGVTYQHKGYISIDLFKKVLPSSNFEYYLCGSPELMKSMVSGLSDWDVPESKIFYEAFGPASIKKKKPIAVTTAGSDSAIVIEFSKTGSKLNWDSNEECILEFAESEDIDTIQSGCRAGSCGSCSTAIISGEVMYIDDPDYDVEAGSCLPCCCVPKNNLVLDA